jgi:hypothetical protein
MDGAQGTLATLSAASDLLCNHQQSPSLLQNSIVEIALTTHRLGMDRGDNLHRLYKF